MKHWQSFCTVLIVMQMAGLVCAQTTSYTELNNLVVIYHHTNAGDLPGTIVQDLQVSLDIASLFYWRNSHMSVLPRWTIFEVTDYMDIVENNGYMTAVSQTTLMMQSMSWR